MTPKHILLGQWGEKLACRHMKMMGFSILMRNYTIAKISEIDIIALDGKELVFTEVKTRTLSRESLSEAINQQKRINLMKVANMYRYQVKLNAMPYRFDVAEILLTPKKRILSFDYFIHAFEPLF